MMPGGGGGGGGGFRYPFRCLVSQPCNHAMFQTAFHPSVNASLVMASWTLASIPASAHILATSFIPLVTCGGSEGICGSGGGEGIDGGRMLLARFRMLLSNPMVNTLVIVSPRFGIIKTFRSSHSYCLMLNLCKKASGEKNA